jgi:hypothetical protein
MKKFYFPIFAALFLLTSFLSQAQVYNSISTNNVTHYTLDDPRFWGGTPLDLTVVPPNTCTGCTISIFSDVTVVPHNGGLAANGGIPTSSLVPGANDPSLDHITLVNSTVNLYGNTTLTLNSYLTLTNSSITIGNNPTSIETIVVNDQVDFDAASLLRLSNDNTLIDASSTSLPGKTTILGPYDEIGNLGFKAAGLYSLFLIGGSYTQTLEVNAIGSVNGQYFAPGGEPYYTINCKPTVPTAAHDCNFGLIYGPTITQNVSSITDPPDATFGVLFAQSTTLPVVLVQFLATKEDDGSVKLSWSTSQELNAGYYDVERSGDQAAWTKIGSVKAKGYSSTTTNYSFTDKQPIDGNGYYRLKMTDLDGKFKYSKTVSVSLKTDTRPLVVYNNPFSDMIRLKVNVSRAQNLTMTVSDMLGKTYINQSYHAQTGDNLVNLPSSITSHGMYVLRIHGESYDQTVKLQKQ